jgi:hypothetical protein
MPSPSYSPTSPTYSPTSPSYDPPEAPEDHKREVIDLTKDEKEEKDIEKKKKEDHWDQIRERVRIPLVCQICGAPVDKVPHHIVEVDLNLRNPELQVNTF